MTLRKFGSRSFGDLKSEKNLKSFIRGELKDIINASVQEYLQKNKIPVASIAINVDKECQNCHPSSQLETNRSVRLNISTSSIDATPGLKPSEEVKKVKSQEDDNLHWMYWKTYDDVPFSTKPKEMKSFTCQTPNSAHRYRCQSPFSRPNTMSGDREFNSNNFGEKTLRERSSSIGPTNRPRFIYEDKVKRNARPMTSVAVGPDRHFEEKGNNTQKSYQVSDYLKKNMDLKDPYERNVYSSLMEVMRKKMHPSCGIESEAGDIDPIIQISEYKHRFQNPRAKIAFPTSKTQTLVTVKKPPLCPHKTRPLGQLRPQTSSTSRFQSGEQFLF